MFYSCQPAQCGGWSDEVHTGCHGHRFFYSHLRPHRYEAIQYGSRTYNVHAMTSEMRMAIEHTSGAYGDMEAIRIQRNDVNIFCHRI